MSKLRKYRSEKRQLLRSLWCCFEYRKEENMDHERRIKDLEDRVRSLDRAICLNAISVILLVLGCFIQMCRINGIYTKISELIGVNNQLIDFLCEVIRNI